MSAFGIREPSSAAACLCSPHHFRAFVLPVELSLQPGVVELRHDPRFQPMFASPWQVGLSVSPESINLATWAYFLLVALGLLTFLLPRSSAR